uniref:NADAR domain protein n=1 Tax=Iridovirus LCIVAC01 TaxID=2506607 RepID=A0A481YPV5_9VIRU|nr:MAG: NADAR domain protein [Iridovirus LCIVAC01]
MVDKTINIFNPVQKPFGALSNNSFSSIIIDNEEWKSVTQYVYSQIQCKPIYRTLVKNQKNAKLAKKVAIDLYLQCIRETTLSATQQALQEKFKDPELTQALLTTGESLLFYDSPNGVLGTGYGPGENLLGKYLREIRNNLRVEFREKGFEEVEETKYDRVYKIYLASRILEEELARGKSIAKYKNKSYDDIIRVDPTLKISKEAVIKLYKAGRLDIVKSELRSPGNLVVFVLKERGVQAISTATRARKDTIFDMYTNYIIEQKYPELTTQNQKIQAISQAFENLNQEQIRDMKDRVINLYNSNKLEPSLQNKIKQELEQLITQKDIEETKPIIQEEEIIEAPEEKLERPTGIPLPRQEIPMPSNIHFSDAGTDPRWAFLSPAFPHMMSIGGRPYPTVTHYIVASLLANLHSNFRNAHKLLMINPEENAWVLDNYKNISDLHATFEHAKEEDWVDTLKDSAKIALDVKFDNVELQNVLLLTGTSTILYTDKTDAVLGTGPDGQGMNFTGIYLMELRDNIKKYKVKEADFLAYITDIAEAQAKIPGLKNWVLSRIRDAIGTASKVSHYLVSLGVSGVSLDKKLAVYVIQTLYDPCKNISFGGQEIGKVPSEIDKFIKDEAKKLNLPVRPKGIFTIWKYAGILTFSLLVNLSGKKPISRLLELKQKLISETKHCWGPFDEVERNCAFSAILNIVQRLVSISQAYGKSPGPGEEVLLTATRVIGIDINELGNETHETKATIRARIKDYLVDTEISESFLSQFTWLVNRVTGAISENMKLRNRVHFFAEYYNPYVEVGKEIPKEPKPGKKKEKLTRKEIELMKQAEEFTR